MLLKYDKEANWKICPLKYSKKKSADSQLD